MTQVSPVENTQYPTTDLPQVPRPVPEPMPEHKASPDFWNRMASMLVSHSSQAQDIRRMAETMEHFQRELADLQATSEKVRQELGEAWELVRTAERERDDARVEQARAQEIVDRQNSTISKQCEELDTRDQRIRELEAALVQARQERDSYKLASEDNARVLQDTRQSLDWSRDNAKRQAERGDRLQTELDRVVRERDDSRSKLLQVQSNFNDMSEKVRSLFEVPQAAVQSEEPQAARIQF